MDWSELHNVIVIIQRTISFLGILIILSGVLLAAYQYISSFFSARTTHYTINDIRLNLGQKLILGLEFIVAADLISTTSAPDFYTVGILGCIVLIRTLLSYSINKEIMGLSKEQGVQVN